jgi:hypothetical protein
MYSDLMPFDINRHQSHGQIIVSTKAGISRFFHQFYEFVEQVVRVVWAGGCFGVVLDAEGRDVFAAEAFVGVVVEIQMRQFDLFFIQCVDVHAEAVVLAGYFDLAGLEVLDRVIGAVVTELELVGLCAERQSENLVAEAYSEDGYFAEQLAYVFDGVVNRRRVAGAVA